MDAIDVSGRSIGRNSALSLVSQMVSLAIGLAAVRWLVANLDRQRFGLLSLATVVLGSVGALDLGLGRAATRATAELLGRRRRDEVSPVLWTTVVTQAFLGFLISALLIALAPLLAGGMLGMSADLADEGRATIRVLAVAIPILLVVGSFSGVLQAAQRFDLVNAVRVPSAGASVLAPIPLIAFGCSLSTAVAAVVLVRIASGVAFAYFAARILPEIRRPKLRWDLVPQLLGFGGWLTVTSIVSPILVYLERLLVASFLSLGALAYYSPPLDAVSGFLLVTGSLTATLFPAFSALGGSQEREHLERFFARSLKYTLMTIGPLVATAMLFAPEALGFWLGADFAERSSTVMRVAAVGVLANSLACVPSTLLQSLGRPDLPAKLHLLELPLYVLVAWVAVSRWELAGAAWAWTFRVSLDAALLFAASQSALGIGLRSLRGNGVERALVMLVLLASAALALRSTMGDAALAFQVASWAVVAILLAWLSWRHVLDNSDRAVVWQVAGFRR